MREGTSAWRTQVTDAHFGVNLGVRRITTHTEDECAGRACVVHSPSEHHMREWPTVYRMDKQITERTCPHGIGHPDPDDLVYQVDYLGRDEVGIHGCDGCCAPRDEA